MKDNRKWQFIDTNVLVYAHDISAGLKHERAKNLIKELWNSELGCISIQVLQEFYVTVTRKICNPIPPEIAASIISDLGHWRMHTPDIADILGAIEIQKSYNLSFWDSMIIQSAKRLNCYCIWTEDLNHGQAYEGIKILNPFITD